MPELPAPVVAYILGLVTDARAPAYLLVEPSGRLGEWGGALETYGISRLEKGRDAGEQVAALVSQSARRLLVRLPAAFPLAPLFRPLASMLAAPPVLSSA